MVYRAMDADAGGRQLARRGDAVPPAAVPDLRLGAAEILG